MRKIKIDKMTLSNKDSHYMRERLNAVHLGNELTAYFTNKKNLTNFIAKTNKMLNITAQELNLIYIELWTEQRKLFLTYHHLFSRSKVRQHIAILERSFDLLVTRSAWTNGNHFSFSYIYKIIEYLNDWVSEAIIIMRKHNRNFSVDGFRVIRERLINVKNKIDTWGEKFTDAPPCPYDNSWKVPFSKRGVDGKGK
ncbi:MAG TPA: hypothetical protein PLB59_07975 [Bacteroidales bacterium]|nr:hypothetical protein [Paludibacteraceae bacterium]HPB25616.1 hypothetical protein [Bacteroidales bacterium]HQN17427.1 hypothetical protein [Bacteroidales bacterium]HQP15891.1 hypothetical protein [Bacteroidales bacterium]